LFNHWGLRLHLNEIVSASKEVLFDGPGDFQLALRSQLFHIQGMNEQMTMGWHVDSNLCRRMFLLNGETNTPLDSLHAFHCDHTRIQTVYHVAGKSSENSYHDFVLNVTTPFIPEQADSWGMPNEEIEEISLDVHRTSRVHLALEQILPGMDKPIAGRSIGNNTFDVSYYYDDLHVFPYVADIVANFASSATIGYVGNNRMILAMLAQFRRLIGHKGQLLCYRDFFGTESALPISCHAADRGEMSACDAYVIDLSMKTLPSMLNGYGLPIPSKCPEVAGFARRIASEIIQLAQEERDLARRNVLPRPFIFLGCHGTSLDPLIQVLFSCALTPLSTYVRSGVLLHDAFERPLPVVPVHFYVIGAALQDSVGWISNLVGEPVGAEEVALAQNLFNIFVSDRDRQRALDALETLLGFDAGRGMLEMQIEISRINGVPEQGEALRVFIAEYEKRPYKTC
jgi:hypothetical protein